MGEIIKILSRGTVLGTDGEIELNHPPVQGQDRQIHLQFGKIRLEMGEKDYVKYALSVLVAEKNLKAVKKLK